MRIVDYKIFIKRNESFKMVDFCFGSDSICKAGRLQKDTNTTYLGNEHTMLSGDMEKRKNKKKLSADHVRCKYMGQKNRSQFSRIILFKIILATSRFEKTPFSSLLFPIGQKTHTYTSHKTIVQCNVQARDVKMIESPRIANTDLRDRPGTSGYTVKSSNLSQTEHEFGAFIAKLHFGHRSCGLKG